MAKRSLKSGGGVMKNRLKISFDYQNFEHNKHLDRLIKETNERYEDNRLGDDLLELVSAAGDAGADSLINAANNENLNEKQQVRNYNAFVD